MNTKEITVLMVEPRKHPKVTKLKDDLDSLQKAVIIGADYQGLIEFVSLGNVDCIMCNEEGKLIGLEGNRRLGEDSSVWEAEAIIDRSAAGETIDMTLFALSIGEISFVFAPYEMFAPTGMHIKENSPFDMTFIATCTNDAFGYLPTEKAYAYEAYETYVARFVPGTAEKVADTYLEMLDKLKKS